MALKSNAELAVTTEALADARAENKAPYSGGSVPGINGPHPGSMYDAIVRAKKAIQEAEVTKQSEEPRITPLPIRTEDEGSRGDFPDNTGSAFEFGLTPKGSLEEKALKRGLVVCRAAVEASQNRATSPSSATGSVPQYLAEKIH